MAFKNEQQEIIFVNTGSFSSGIEKSDANKIMSLFYKSYMNKNLYPTIIDNEFKQLVNFNNTEEQSLENFFNNYEQIKEIIPLTIPSASHLYLIEQGQAFINAIDVFDKVGAEEIDVTVKPGATIDFI